MGDCPHVGRAGFSSQQLSTSYPVLKTQSDFKETGGLVMNLIGRVVLCEAEGIIRGCRSTTSSIFPVISWKFEHLGKHTLRVQL